MKFLAKGARKGLEREREIIHCAISKSRTRGFLQCGFIQFMKKIFVLEIIFAHLSIQNMILVIIFIIHV